MVLHLAFQRGFHDHLRQPRQQPALTGQPQALRPGPLTQLRYQLLIQRVPRSRGSNRLRIRFTNHISHGDLLILWSYTF
jgi:hypothetical protein